MTCPMENCEVKLDHKHVPVPAKSLPPSQDVSMQYMQQKSVDQQKRIAELEECLRISQQQISSVTNDTDNAMARMTRKFDAVASSLDAQTEETRKATAALLQSRQALAILVEGLILDGTFSAEAPFVVPISVFTLGS